MRRVIFQVSAGVSLALCTFIAVLWLSGYARQYEVSRLTTNRWQHLGSDHGSVFFASTVSASRAAKGIHLHSYTNAASSSYRLWSDHVSGADWRISIFSFVVAVEHFEEGGV